MKKIFFVLGLKGGAGKTKIAVDFLPLVTLYRAQKKKEDLTKNKIIMHLIDNNNENDFITKQGSAISIKSKIETDNDISIEQFNNEVEDFYFKNKSDTYLIADIGGGDDSRVLIEEIANSAVKKKSIVFIPFFIEKEYITSMKNTIDLLYENIDDNDVPIEICIIANKVGKKIINAAKHKKISVEEEIKNEIENILGKEAYNAITKEINNLVILKDFQKEFNRIKSTYVMMDYILPVLKSGIMYEEAREKLDKQYSTADSEDNRTFEKSLNILRTSYDLLRIYKNCADFNDGILKLIEK